MLEVIGGVVIVLSFAVFVIAVIGLFKPEVVRLPHRVYSVGVWVISAVLLVIGGSLLPDAPSTSAGTQVQTTGGVQASPEPVQVSSVTFLEVNEKFGLQSDLTDLQKDREWPAYRGLCVEWTGELVSLSETFLGRGFNIQFKHLPTTFVSDVLARAPASAEDDLLTWREGQQYTYLARLDDYGGLLPITVSMGCD